MRTKEELRALCAEINAQSLEEEDFNLRILVYIIATELTEGNPSVYRQRLEETLDFLLPKVKDKKLWPYITLCPVTTLWSLFDMDNRTIFFLVAKVTIGDEPCEIVFRQEQKREGCYRAMYFIDYLRHRSRNKSFRKAFSKEEFAKIRYHLEKFQGMKNVFFDPSRKTIFAAEAHSGESGFAQLHALYETLDEVSQKIADMRETAVRKETMKEKSSRTVNFINDLFKT